jgi:hypothetical protein
MSRFQQVQRRSLAKRIPRIVSVCFRATGLASGVESSGDDPSFLLSSCSLGVPASTDRAKGSFARPNVVKRTCSVACRVKGLAQNKAFGDRFVGAIVYGRSSRLSWYWLVVLRLKVCFLIGLNRGSERILTRATHEKAKIN